MRDIIKLRITWFCSLVILAVSVTLSGPRSASTRSSPAGLDDREALIAAMKSMLSAASYRARMESSSSSGTTSTSILEFVAPDRLHLTRETNRPGRSPIRQESITIEDETWMKIANAGWQQFPMKLGDLIKQLRDPKVVEEITSSTDVRFVRSEALDGSPMLVYQYSLGDRDGAGLKTSAKTWISRSDNLPRKTESEGTINLAGKQVNTRTITTYYDYGADIKIERPRVGAGD